MTRYFIFVSIFCLSLVACVLSSGKSANFTLLFQETDKLYHGVYPGGRTGEEDDILPSDLHAYENSVGHKAAWVYFSNNWYSSRDFPNETVNWIIDEGAVPYIRLMLRSSPETGKAEPVFTLQAILKGDFDNDFKTWARAAKNIGQPIIVEWGTEMNGSWFSWNASWNGEEHGAQKFQDAYKHIIDLMKAEGAMNLIWVFHVNAGDYPEASWNALERYYPGDDYIDWLALSTYGTQSPNEEYISSFTERVDAVVPRLKTLAPDKPIIVAEFASAQNAKFSAAEWADEALEALISNRWPDIKGFAWWNETWQNDSNTANDTDMRVQSVEGLANVFQEYLKSERVAKDPLYP